MRTSLVLAALMIAFASTAQAGGDQWRRVVSERIDALLSDKLLRSSQAGIAVYDLTDDRMIYRHHSRQAMRPASTQKLMTAITALEYLGAGHRMTTTISCSRRPEGNVLGDTIYCRGGFDPMLSSSDVAEMMLTLKDSGIDTIRGLIVLDKSMKDNLEFGRGWCWDDDNPILSPLTADAKDIFPDILLKAMDNAGIVHDAEFGYGMRPDGTVVICSRHHTVEEVMLKMMKESDNFYAEALFYNIAAASEKPWASADDAAARIRQLASRLGHEKSEFRVADGSGLSLYNYTTPEIETSFLRHAYRSRHIFNALYPSLPIAGKDGTLKRRMTDDPHARGNVHAKTGSVTAVSSLAGYCTAGNGHMIAFCIINQGVMRCRDGRDFQDRVCAILCSPIKNE